MALNSAENALLIINELTAAAIPGANEAAQGFVDFETTRLLLLLLYDLQMKSSVSFMFIFPNCGTVDWRIP